MKSSQVLLIVVLSLSGVMLNSCRRSSSHTLTVVCDSSETASVPFHLLYMTDNGQTSQGFLETHFTPFQLEFSGTDFIVVVSDSIMNGPRLCSKLDSRTSGGMMCGSPALFRPRGVATLY